MSYWNIGCASGTSRRPTGSYSSPTDTSDLIYGTVEKQAVPKTSSFRPSNDSHAATVQAWSLTPRQSLGCFTSALLEHRFPVWMKQMIGWIKDSRGRGASSVEDAIVASH